MTDKRKYLEDIPVDRFYEIVPKRNKVIEAADASLPRYEYNANVLDHVFHPNVQHVVVSDVKQMKDARLYTLKPDQEKGTKRLAPFRAGQYVSVSLKIEDSLLTRPYSLCSAPSEAANGYQIIVKTMKDGYASGYINRHWQVGTKVDLSAPCGFFYYERLRDSKNVLGLAGGSGIAPFMAMARAIAEGTEDFNLTLLFGSRTEADILFKEELADLASRCDKLKVVHVLSDERKDGYEHGFITAGLIEKYAAEDTSVFVCGSQGMYDFIENEAKKLGIKRRRLRFDAYGDYRLTKRDVEVAETKEKTYTVTVTLNDGIEHKITAKGNESLLVAFERAGLAAPSHCRSGECGWCRCRLAAGTVYMPEKTERRRAYDKETGYIHACCAFPTSDCVVFINYEKPEVTFHAKDMAQKNITMGVTMSVLVSGAMGFLATFLLLKNNPQAATSFPMGMYVANIVLSIILGLVIAKTLPLGKLGRKLANKAGAKNGSFKFTLFNAIPLSIGNTFIISLLLSLFGVEMARMRAPREAVAQMPPMLAMWLGSWAKMLLPTMLASYLVVVVFSPVVSDIIGFSTAGAEIGRASARDTSIAGRNDKKN